MQNKMVPWLIVLIIVLVGGGAMYYVTNVSKEHVSSEQGDGGHQEGTMEDKINDQKMMEAEGGSAAKDDSAVMMRGEAKDASKVGAYEPYDPKLIANAATGKVVLFFRASWCPTCQVINADILANLNAIPQGVTILDVDYDKSDALKRKYGVIYQHTFVQVDKDGNQIAKWSGSPTLADIVKHLK